MIKYIQVTQLKIRSVETFFDKWSEDMAYVLGYFATDGSMYINKNGSPYIAFYSIDFDGDGNVFYQTLIRRNRPSPTHHLHLNIRCGNRIFLENLRLRISKLISLKGGSIYFHSGAYNLAYYGKDVIELYSFLYPQQAVPCLSRKRQALKEGLKKFGIEV